MSYCINPDCPTPQNPENALVCRACGSKLLLRDRYQAIQPLGQGGFGATFLAKDRNLPGQPVCVIKELRPKVSEPHLLEMARDLFKREADTLGKIGNHPQVPRLLDYFEWNQQFYLVQDFVEGATLKQEVKKYGAFTEEQIKEFLSEILPVLQYIHGQKVIHRDIKPANIIRRSQDNHLVLIDFGAVKDKVQHTTLSATTGETVYTNYAIGTTGFAPIEQIRQRPVYASDIYAVGATCIYLLTTQSPGSLGEDPTTGKILWRPQVSVSPQLGEILDKMLEPLVGRRFQSADEVLRALNAKPDAMNLSGGLVTKPKSGNKVEDPTVFNAGASSLVSEASPFSGMAQSIRNRNAQSRGTGSKTNLTKTNLTQTSKGSTGKMSTSGGQSQNRAKAAAPTPTKWDARSILNAYHKGARDFDHCDLSGQNLQNMNLSGVNFYGAKLDRTNLQGANLSNVQFGPATLMQANLKGANLTKAYFSTANLEGADLSGADLSGAYLRSANLRGANLRGANLLDATISNDQIASAKTNWRTLFPDGKRGSGL